MLSIRPATTDDVSLIRTMIRELAEFEHELDSVTIADEDLAQDGFGKNPKYRAFILEWDGRVAGYALVFDCYSTWMGRQFFVEDLFVRAEFRGKGIGKSALAYLARLAKNEGYRAMRWEVLAWNQPAVDLYRRLGGEFLDDWKLVMLRGEALDRLAEQVSECKK